MNAKLKINARVRRIVQYIDDLDKGLLQIPAFQRDFVWENSQKMELFDSLKRGYPIGSILLWQPTDNRYDSRPLIGPYTVPKRTENFFYILDGFQRLSTIFGFLINPYTTALPCDLEKWKKEFRMYYDLETEEFIMPRTESVEVYQVPVYDLINSRAAFALEKKLSKDGLDEKTVSKYIDRYALLGANLIDFQLPSIDISGGEIEEVVEIFSRTNSKGAPISPDWMVSALTYDKEAGFRLGTEIDGLLEELKTYNFQGVKRELLLQCITNSFGKSHLEQSTHIERLLKEQKSNFIPVAKKTLTNVKKAVKFMFEELLVIDSKLLPYGIQLIFITDFFNQIPDPSPSHLEKLKKWFWASTYANYFSLYSISKQREAYRQFQKFIKNENEEALYKDKPGTVFVTVDFPDKINFGSVRATALILFMLNHANGFHKISAEETEGLSLNYLFYDGRDERGNFLPEGAVAVTEASTRKFRKSKDMSFLLSEYQEGFPEYFLDKGMTALFKEKQEGFKDLILEKRKLLIMEAEKSFVEQYGVVYGE